METVIIDYGSGNLHSALKSFQKVANLNKKGHVTVTADPKLVRYADKVVLPGVGSFNDCLTGLKSNNDLYYNLTERVLKDGVPFLGICVGFQLLADYGHENVVNTPGLGWLGGEVKKICLKNKDIKIPHMGWNSLIFDREHPLTKKLTSEDRPNIIAAIAEARGHGDLSENAEYHSAREKQSFIEGRIKEIEAIISLADVIDPTTLAGAIKFGATVTLVDEDTDEEKTWLIVGEYEANIEAGLLNIKSPIARALIGKDEGDSVEVKTPGGEKAYEILKIQYK